MKIPGLCRFTQGTWSIDDDSCAERYNTYDETYQQLMIKKKIKKQNENKPVEEYYPGKKTTELSCKPRTVTKNPPPPQISVNEKAPLTETATEITPMPSLTEEKPEEVAEENAKEVAEESKEVKDVPKDIVKEKLAEQLEEKPEEQLVEKEPTKENVFIFYSTSK